MIVTYRWLQDYVDFDTPIAELSHRLTMAGFEVEEVRKIGGDYDNVVTALIEKVEPHPDADRLTVCTVFDGQERFQVVCGASNTEAGRIGVLARVGAKLPGGKLKKGKIRGVESFGMLCARDELGISDDHTGIWLLPEGTPLGLEPLAAQGLDDWAMELGVTPNRPDALSVIGVAREVAALVGKPLKKTDLEIEPEGGAIDEYMTIEIEAPDKCPRYCGMLVKGVKIAPSPPWMVHRLEAAGVRAINNIVDITNFVLLEYGQPLHAFDYSFLSDRRIVVRCAKDGETITTLDEQVRPLDGDDLLICDGVKPVALAGIMGGLNSLVSDDTVDVFIESAYFEPTGIRRTSRKLELSSESSYRFERGTGVENTVLGAHRAARLMAELAGGTLVPGFIDAYPKTIPRRQVAMRPAKVNALLGIDLDAAQMITHLESIELRVVDTSPDRLVVEVPSFRPDLEREVDLAEEIARLHGYENIPLTIHMGVDAENRPWALRDFLRDLRRELAGMGLSETISLAFVAPEALAAVGAPEGIRLANPLSEDFAVLRTSLLPSLLGAVATNQARRLSDIRIFEARRVYLPQADDDMPTEPHHLGLLVAGSRQDSFWTGESPHVDFYDLKGLVERLLTHFGLRNVTWRVPADAGPFLPGVCAEMLIGENSAGRIGKLRTESLEIFGIEGEVFAGELNLDMIAAQADREIKYQKLSKFPAMFRDIAVLADEEASVDRMLAAIREIDTRRITRLHVFDVYKGKGIPPGKKSVAFSMWFQDLAKNLSDKDADKLTKKILRALKEGLGATLRE
ncbi:MAG: phenylalanine--tRNA ligase subunit beta [Candidatus Lernaella stagnicola]|nr:phenylalanine--tRNA ligase subunit beta [Candidatus Lernaella stagnicola]